MASQKFIPADRLRTDIYSEENQRETPDQSSPQQGSRGPSTAAERSMAGVSVGYSSAAQTLEEMNQKLSSFMEDDFWKISDRFRNMEPGGNPERIDAGGESLAAFLSTIVALGHNAIAQLRTGENPNELRGRRRLASQQALRNLDRLGYYERYNTRGPEQRLTLGDMQGNFVDYTKEIAQRNIDETNLRNSELMAAPEPDNRVSNEDKIANPSSSENN